MIAVRGLMTESIGAPSTGIPNPKASMDQAVETSSGLRVRREGTTAMSSNAYARRARLARPSSISMVTPPAYPRTRPRPRSLLAKPGRAEVWRGGGDGWWGRTGRSPGRGRGFCGSSGGRGSGLLAQSCWIRAAGSGLLEEREPHGALVVGGGVEHLVVKGGGGCLVEEHAGTAIVDDGVVDLRL